jgi:hypothetical protein
MSFVTDEVRVERFSAPAGVTGGIEVAAVALGSGSSTFRETVVVNGREVEPSEAIVRVLREVRLCRR